MNSNLNAPHFKDEQAAYAYVEAGCGLTVGLPALWQLRCDPHPQAGWPGPRGLDSAKCNECRKQFTVKSERSLRTPTFR